MKYLDWAGKVRVSMTMFYNVMLVLSGMVAGVLASQQLGRATTYPYTVISRVLIGADGDSGKLARPAVPPMGDVTMQRLIEYHDINCERWYERKAVSEVRSGTDAGYVQRFDPIHEQRLPAELSGRPQTWSASLDHKFPCGDAFLVEDVTLSCSWLNEWFRRMHKPTIITAFRVAGDGC